MNPELPVEIKPSNRARKLQEGKLRKQKQKAVLKRQQEDEQRWHMEMRSDLGGYRGGGCLCANVWLGEWGTPSQRKFLNIMCQALSQTHEVHFN